MDPREGVVVKAEDIKHVLREKLVILPGSRDNQGRFILIFKPKEGATNVDNLRNVLLYLHTLYTNNEKGYTVILDMRGKMKWETAKPMLKAMNQAMEKGSICVNLVLIIRPDNFWEKQKASIAHSVSKASVEVIGMESLARYVDVSQLPRDLGGSFPFDYDDWLDTRLELESLIWRVSEWMRSLEENREKMLNAPLPICVQTALAAIELHKDMQKRILSVPIEKLEEETHRIVNRIKCGAQRECDLDASVPHIRSNVVSLEQLKKDVLMLWEKNREQIRQIHQCKLVERESNGMVSWLKSRADVVAREMNEVGESVEEMEERLREMRDLEDSLKHMDVNVNGVNASASRAKCSSSHVSKMSDEYLRLSSAIQLRTNILAASIAFKRAQAEYLSDWAHWRGIRVDEVANRNDKESVVAAIENNEHLWKAADSVYIAALDAGSKLCCVWREADCVSEEQHTKERLALIGRTHMQLAIVYKEQKKLLSTLIAYDAFEQDVKKVFDWLTEHGEPYLRKNTAIGDNAATASNLRNNHMEFRKIARSTYDNAKKLFEVANDCLSSGVVDECSVRAHVAALQERMSSFEAKVEARLNVLSQATLFYTHYHELLNWYDEMSRKYSEVLIHSSPAQCEHESKQWSMESDGTAVAYATTVGEGERLMRNIEEYALLMSIPVHSHLIDKISVMMKEIDERNASLMQLWNKQRHVLQFALKFAERMSDLQGLVDQLTSWEKDMFSLVHSVGFLENAEKVFPYHKDNEMKVRSAIDKELRAATELLQLMNSRDMGGAMTTEGLRVEDALRDKLAEIDELDTKIMKTSKETSRRLEGARKVLAFRSFCNDLKAACDSCTRRVSKLSALPTNLNDALRMASELKELQNEFEAREKKRAEGYRKQLDEVLRASVIERQEVVEWNHEVVRAIDSLALHFNSRHRALKAGADFYRTYNHITPILDHLEKEYAEKAEEDACCSVEGKSNEEKAKALAQLLSTHLAVRDKFQKGCTVAQKTSDVFLKYIQRCDLSMHQQQCFHHVQQLRGKVREQQARILETWARRKRQLDRCQQYVLLESSREQLSAWLKGEGEGMVRSVRESGSESERAEVLHSLTLALTTHKASVQTMLVMGESMAAESEHHRQQVLHCVTLMREEYDAFVAVVGALNVDTVEIALRRLSDTSMAERDEEEKKRKRKISEPMRELLKTERVYIEDVKRCIDVYVGAVERMERDDELPALLVGRRADIFGNIEEIYNFHSRTFLAELEKYEKDAEFVGYSFTVYVGALCDLYTTYCAHKDLNKSLLHMPDTVSFFESVREAHSLDTSNSLDSLLIKPVQRITRYSLLMGELCKNAAGEAFKEALEVVANIPKRANDICHLNYLDAKDKEKLGPTGPLVTQDTLVVCESRTLFKGKGKERQVFLFEMALVITKRVGEASSSTIRYLLKGKPILLREVASVVEHVEGDVCTFALRLGGELSGSNESRIEMRASSETAKMNWIRRLRECIHNKDLEDVHLSVNVSATSAGSGKQPSSDGASVNSDDLKRNSVQSNSSSEVNESVGRLSLT